VIRAGRHGTQVIGQQAVPPKVGFLLQEQVTGHRVDVHHVRVGGLGKSISTNEPGIPAWAPAL